MLCQLLSSRSFHRVVIGLFLLGAVSMLGAQAYAEPRALLGLPASGDSTKTTEAPAAAAAVNAPSMGPFVFAYDEAGRLVGVTDAVGNTATYTYDAAGNVLSIGRGTSTVSILAFSPSSGPVGTNVTITGAGFDATATRNAVTFNGVPAAVVSATQNQLVAVVPAGAMTGPIRVTSRTGSAVSAASFTVVSNNAPSISGFKPTIGTAGSAVTITGTNFERVAVNNRISFNGNLGAVSATIGTTTLGSVLPSSATSGHITVSTPNGSATSTDDFFVPPSPYTVADIEVTGRMAVGETRAVTFSQPKKISLTVFDGSAGQRIALRISSNNDCGFVSIFRPDGSSLVGSTQVCSTSFIDRQTLSVSGTYLIMFVATGTETDIVTMTLYNVPQDVTASIVPGGPPVSVTLTTPGQHAAVTFAGSVGQRIALGISPAVAGGGCGDVSILRPDGASLVDLSEYHLCDTSIFFGPDVLPVLPVSGTYLIVLNPAGQTGSIALTLYNVPPDVMANIVPGGSPVTVTTTTPGQKDIVTFAGSAGQHVSLKAVFGAGMTDACNWISILKPDGAELSIYQNYACDPLYFSGVLVMPATGIYTITVSPGFFNDGRIGSTTLTLYNVPPDVAASIAVDGSPVTVTTTTPGQRAILTFSGSAGQPVSLNVSFGGGMTDPACNLFWLVMILSPDGTELNFPYDVACGSLYSSGVLVLPATGAYTITLAPGSVSVGSATLTLYTPLAVVSISPRGGSTLGGTPVVLSGAKFQAGATVSIGGVPTTSVVVVNSTTITAVTGAHEAGLATVTVTNSDNLSGSLVNGYFYDPPSGALSFFTLAPCRLVDTRNASGPLGGPALAAGSQRFLPLTGHCGIPAGAKVISVNVTVTGPASSGFLSLYPGNALPLGTSNINFSTGQTRASNAIIQLASDGSGSVGVLNGASGTVHLILDVNGYFQ
jgi:YD repeat-containing protein